MERLTAEQIVNETVQWYENNPRSLQIIDVVGSTTCLYLNDEEQRCAHSRCLTEEALEYILKNNLNNGSAVNVITQLSDKCHIEKYQGQPDGFWSELQRLHDTDPFWKRKDNGNELAYKGKCQAQFIKFKYGTQVKPENV